MSGFDFHVECSRDEESFRKVKQKLILIDFESWDSLRKIQKTTCYDSNSDDLLFSELPGILDVSLVAISSFELKEIGAGYIIWGWKDSRAFGPEDKSKADLLVEQVALSLAVSINRLQSKKQARKLATLLELSSSLYSSLNYKEVLDKVARITIDITGGDGAAIFIANNEDENKLALVLTYKDPKAGPHIPEMTKQLAKFADEIASNGVGKIADPEQANRDDNFIDYKSTISLNSMVGSPLIWSEKIFGVIVLWNEKKVSFNQDDLELLTIISRLTDKAYENARLYEDLSKAYKELSETQERLMMAGKLTALAEMAGGVAHDFNNMLGAILGRVQLMLLKCKDRELKKELGLIENAALDGRRTVQRLQNFTQVTSKKEFMPQDLNLIIKQAIDNTKPAWKDISNKNSITINVQVDLKPVSTINGNEEELVEAVSNVILNSIDALKKGGNIFISTFMDADYAVLKIVDDGIGMSEDVKNKLFFPFFTTKGDVKGSGLGLAVVYGILFRHQVDIAVDSEPGKGAEFTFKFNCIKGPIARRKDIIEEINHQNLSILLVDDDVNLLDVVGDMIEYIGHKCEKAPGGKEAIEILKSRRFDLVVTDLGMPEVGGWEVAEFCRLKYPEIPVVLISGWGAQIDEKEALRKVDAVLAKPFRIEEFQSILQKVLSLQNIQ